MYLEIRQKKSYHRKGIRHCSKYIETSAVPSNSSVMQKSSGDDRGVRQVLREVIQDDDRC